MRGSVSNACGTEGTIGNFVECLLSHHTDEDNPRNRNQRAFTEAPITSAESCQVSLEAVGTNGIRFSQYVTPESTRSRTFSVTIN